MAYHLYISGSGGEWLSHFLMDEQTGDLEAQENIPIGGQPAALATNASETLMFMSLRPQKQFGSYAIDRTSGGLTEIGIVEIDEGAAYVRTDNTDRYLLASYYGAGHVSVHRIGDDGALSAKPLQWVETEGHAHSIQTDRSNRFVFVPHTNPANAIYQFRFDEATGTLTANDPPKVQPDTPEGPRHYVFHPDKDILYSVNEDGSTVSAHHLDPEGGTLSSFQVISTLPAGFDGDSVTAEIEITSDGKYLYASNRGHDSLALFAVSDNGTLTAKGHFATEPTPRFFALDPTGRFLYALGQGSGRLASYRVDADSGALEPLKVYEVGGSPAWIQFVKQG
jgi:6-phosphogluconolactonase